MKMPKSILFMQLRTKFNQKAGFEVLKSNVFIDYRKNKFTMTFENKEIRELIKKEGKVEEYSEFSEMLIKGVNKQLKAEEIQVINLNIYLKEKKSDAVIYYIKNGEKVSSELNEVF